MDIYYPHKDMTDEDNRMFALCFQSRPLRDDERAEQMQIAQDFEQYVYANLDQINHSRLKRQRDMTANQPARQR